MRNLEPNTLLSANTGYTALPTYQASNINGIYRQGIHGGDLERVAESIGISPSKIHDFSTTENFFAAELSKKLVTQCVPFTGRTPEGGNHKLKTALAEFEGLAAENIICAGSRDALIWQILSALSPRSILFIGPVYAEYIIACEALHIEWQIVTPDPKDEFTCTEATMKALRQSNAELSIICTPNGASGSLYENMQYIFAVLKSTRIILDLSQRDFFYTDPIYRELFWNYYYNIAHQGSRVVCLHSFAEFFSCPGTPLAYASGDAQLLKEIEKLGPAASVNALASQMGLLMLEERAKYYATLKELTAEKFTLDMALRRINVFDPALVFAGPGFFCCGLNKDAQPGQKLNGAAHKLQTHLLHHRILVRNCDNIPGMPEGFVRIRVQDAEHNAKLINGLEKYCID